MKTQKYNKNYKIFNLFYQKNSLITLKNMLFSPLLERKCPPGLQKMRLKGGQSNTKWGSFGGSTGIGSMAAKHQRLQCRQKIGADRCESVQKTGVTCDQMLPNATRKQGGNLPSLDITWLFLYVVLLKQLL